MLSTTQKVIEETVNVNTLCETIHSKRDVLLGTIVYKTVLSHQEDSLKSDLGSRYTRNKTMASFCCPQCRSHFFTRKGKRHRNYKSVLGKTVLPILQVQCSSCQYRFCPYKEQIGLAFTDRIGPTLKQRQLELTCHISYQKARGFIESCLGISSSGPSIRKEIDRQAETLRKMPVTANNRIVYHDSTKVKAGLKERGVSIHLAVTTKTGRHHRRQKQLLFLKTGGADQIKKSLKALKAKGIVHDGDMNLSGCAPLLQRCLWHLVHQLKHFLWQDGLSLKARASYVKELIDILYRKPSVTVMKNDYRRFTNRLKRNDLIKCVVHLQNAEHEIATFRELGLKVRTTSLVEREMREINRRVNNGVRWSIPGVENLLLVKMFLALNNP